MPPFTQYVYFKTEQSPKKYQYKAVTKRTINLKNYRKEDKATGDKATGLKDRREKIEKKTRQINVWIVRIRILK